MASAAYLVVGGPERTSRTMDSRVSEKGSWSFYSNRSRQLHYAVVVHAVGSSKVFLKKTTRSSKANRAAVLSGPDAAGNGKRHRT